MPAIDRISIRGDLAGALGFVRYADAAHKYVVTHAQLVDAIATYAARHGWAGLGIDRDDPPTQTALIEEAIKLAVTNNVRRWRYVQSILERWRVEGRKDALGQRDTQRNLQRQIPSEYDDIIQR